MYMQRGTLRGSPASSPLSGLVPEWNLPSALSELPRPGKDRMPIPHQPSHTQLCGAPPRARGSPARANWTTHVRTRANCFLLFSLTETVPTWPVACRKCHHACQAPLQACAQNENAWAQPAPTDRRGSRCRSRPPACAGRPDLPLLFSNSSLSISLTRRRLDS